MTRSRVAAEFASAFETVVVVVGGATIVGIRSPVVADAEEAAAGSGLGAAERTFLGMGMVGTGTILDAIAPVPDIVVSALLAASPVGA